VFSPLVVLRRLAFVGDGMAHAAFGGLGIALLLITGSGFYDASVQAATLVFCLALGIGVAIVSRRSGDEGIAEDSAIGIAFSVSMALGAFCIALRNARNPQYITSIEPYLFGSLLNISRGDLIVLAVVTALVLLALVLFQKEILFYTFDAHLAEVSGLNVGLIHHAFLLLLVLTVVLSSRMVGIVLVSASVIIPGVTALRLCRRLMPAIVLSGVLGVVSFELGLYAAYVHGRIHPGSAIVLIQFALLLIGGVVSQVQKRIYRSAG
jgi:ABC-type Mn2+/Zn2+ transport system permease subunit